MHFQYIRSNKRKYEDVNKIHRVKISNLTCNHAYIHERFLLVMKLIANAAAVILDAIQRNTFAHSFLFQWERNFRSDDFTLDRIGA